MLIKFWPENLKGRDHPEDLDVDVKIILEWILVTQGGKLTEYRNSGGTL
jgi:hypothetical protein